MGKVCLETFRHNDPFLLTSLVYVEKFEFENHTIMEDKQCKHMEQFLAMAKERDYFSVVT